MEAECLPFAAVPHSSRLFVDFVSRFPQVAKFYSAPPTFREWIAKAARSLNFESARRQIICAVLARQNQSWGSGQRALDNIARLRAGASAIVTGQQVALFGGPLFAIFKAISVARIADFSTQAGSPAVPVFWLATEDHDFAEVNHVAFPSPEGTLQTLTLESRGQAARNDSPISHIPLGPEIGELVKAAGGLLHGSELAEILRHSYLPEENLGSAFAKLFARLFADIGIILLDPADAELHAVAEPIYRQAVEQAAALDQALLERGRALETAGYHRQVKVTPSSTLLFAMQNGARTPVHLMNGDFKIGEKKISASDLLRQITEAPQNFSANVLLRPVVQDFLLPTAAYVGGPAEVAYFAQAAVVYQKLLGRITPIVPRLSATLVTARERRLLQRYSINLPDLFNGPEHLRELLASRGLPSELDARFDSAAKSLASSLDGITASLQRLDPSLVQAARRAASKMQYQLNRLRRRAARSQLARDEQIRRHADELATTLYPNKTLQERELAGISFLASQGLQLLKQLYDSAEISCPDHQIIYL